MRKSLVIFDEIHAYDAETFGLIKSLIKHLYYYYDSRFCIMSATFPDVLRDELSFLDAKELISQSTLKAEYSKRRRTRLEFHDNYIYDKELAIYIHGPWTDELSASEQINRTAMSIASNSYSIPLIGYSWDSNTSVNKDGWQTAKIIAERSAHM